MVAASALPVVFVLWASWRLAATRVVSKEERGVRSFPEHQRFLLQL